jgi:hypothetical protein
MNLECKERCFPFNEDNKKKDLLATIEVFFLCSWGKEILEQID